MENVEEQAVIRGWRLTAAREVVGISSVKKLAAHLAEVAELRPAGEPKPRGFSAPHLNAIERGDSTLSPLAADYIARAIGISTTFFTAPAARLGDIAASASPASEPLRPTPLSLLVSSGAEGLVSEVAAELEELDQRLDEQAEGKPLDLPQADTAGQPRSRTGG